MPTSTNRYGELAAEVYDLDKPYGALADTAFHLERLQGVHGSILEPACGSGRTLVPLLDAGLDVAGFDPSEAMLARCRARCAEAGHRPNLSRQRFEDFAYDQPFAAILVPVGSFTLIDDFAVAMAVLKRFHAHLQPGGLLMLDVQGLAYLANQRVDRRRWTTPDGDLLTLEGLDLENDWLRQRRVGSCRYERWRDGRLMESEIDIMVQRFWGLEEFQLALQATGFRDISVVGGYDRPRAPSASDRVWTFEARRV